ncbi:MAG: ATP-binding cassette domain-containing protein [Thomasclavelia ramosa]
MSIKIEQQKCIAIVGENGSGKSTLLSSLLGAGGNAR